MDLNKIKQKLAEHNAAKQQQGSGTQGELFWKPKPGLQKIRIVQSPHNPDFPGTELFFYYEFGKPMLAPVTFGLPDPVVKFCNTLKAEKGEKSVVSNNWKIATKIGAKKRAYIPVILRGTDDQPDTGPFYWPVAPTYYDEILKLYADEDYGDISDIEKGRDLTIEFVPATKEGAFPETFIRPRGNPSIMTNDPELFDRVKNIKNILDVYKCPTEEELSTALREYLSGVSTQNTPSDDAPKPPSPEANKIADEFSAKFGEIFNNTEEPSKKSDGDDDLPF